MQDLAVIDEPSAAVTMLEPTRSEILKLLGEPGTATTLAKSLGVSRQKVNYHLRALESHGLVRLVEERPRRGLTERVVVASARSYVLSTETLGPNAADPERTDRFSTQYLIAVAARLVREVATMTRGAQAANKPLATLTIDAKVRFATAADRAAFTAELADAVTSLTSRYHSERSPRGRWHRLVVAAHPLPKNNSTNKET